jgi:hypothetical protein
VGLGVSGRQTGCPEFAVEVFTTRIPHTLIRQSREMPIPRVASPACRWRCDRSSDGCQFAAKMATPAFGSKRQGRGLAAASGRPRPRGWPSTGAATTLPEARRVHTSTLLTGGACNERRCRQDKVAVELGVEMCQSKREAKAEPQSAPGFLYSLFFATSLC